MKKANLCVLMDKRKHCFNPISYSLGEATKPSSGFPGILAFSNNAAFGLANLLTKDRVGEAVCNHMYKGKSSKMLLPMG